MKNKSFIIIVFVSIAVFSLLLFSVYKINSNKALTFYGNGYISEASSESSEKIYFNASEVYKNGYNNEVIFKNTDNKKTEVSKYSFVFYDDNSIGYLTDGVLMDLNTVGNDFIPYYNIKNNYIIKNKNNKFIINTTDKDIEFNNFIGRISEDKYIVAGNNLRLKLSGNDELVNGKYFELIFSDGNIVKIDNKDLSVQTVSSECYILVGDDVKIDLSTRKISYQNEEKVSLEEIIINHDDNINIMYEKPENENSGGENGSGKGNGSGTGNGSGSESTNTGPQYIIPEINIETQTEYVVESVINYKEVPHVEVINTSTSSKRINIDFNVIDNDKLISGPVYVKYLDLNSGVSYVTSYDNYDSLINYSATDLASNTDYVITIYASYNRNSKVFPNYVMFQRTISTKDLGISVEKDYVTSKEISVNAYIGDKTITSGKLNLYDTNDNLIDEYTFTGGTFVNHVFVNDIHSNTNYIVKVEDINYGGVVNKGVYATASIKTLKYNPLETAPILKVTSDIFNNNFEIGVETISMKEDGDEYIPVETYDHDGIITKALYNIYNSKTGELVKSIEKDNLSLFKLEIGDDIKASETYYYDVIVTLKDNEKIIDKSYRSAEFAMTSRKMPSAEFKFESYAKITAKTIEGVFAINDVDNAIDTNKSAKISYTSRDGDKNDLDLNYSECSNYDYLSDDIKNTDEYKCVFVQLKDLKSENEYSIVIDSFVDLNKVEDEKVLEPQYMQIGAIKLNTNPADTIYTNLTENYLEDVVEAQEKVFDFCIKFESKNEEDDLILQNLKRFKIALYQGKNTSLNIADLIATIPVENTLSYNIYEKFVSSENGVCYTISDFGIDINTLKEKNNLEGLKENYTIALLDGETKGNQVEFIPDNLVLNINSQLISLSKADAKLSVGVVRNVQLNENKDLSLKDDTIVGIYGIPSYEINSDYVSSIDFYICDYTSGELDKSKVYDSNATDDIKKYCVRHSYLDKTLVEKNIQHDFLVTDGDVKRGHIYRLYYQMNIDINKDYIGDEFVYPISKDNDAYIEAPNDIKDIKCKKQAPDLNLFTWESTNDSIVYKYFIDDVDNSLNYIDNKAGIFYKIGENEYSLVTHIDCSKETCKEISNINNNYDRFKINGLANNDNYSVYLDANLIDNGKSEKIKVDDYLFEGSFDMSGLEYQVENQYNNIVHFKLMPPLDGVLNTMTSRVVYYTLKLTYKGHEVYIDNITTQRAKASEAVLDNYYYKNVLLSYKENTGSDLVSISNYGKNEEHSDIAYVTNCKTGDGVCVYLDYSKLYGYGVNNNISVFKDIKDADVNVDITLSYDSGEAGYNIDNNELYTLQVKNIGNMPSKYESLMGKYVYVKFGSQMSDISYNNDALQSVYMYNPSHAGFGLVDYYTSDANVSKTGGALSIINYSGLNFFDYVKVSGVEKVLYNHYTYQNNYSVGPMGVIIADVPVVAKKIDSSHINGLYGVEHFTADKIKPSFGINTSTSTSYINGVLLKNANFSGYDPIESDEEKIYFRVFNNGEDLPLKEYEVPKNNLNYINGINDSSVINLNTSYDFVVTGLTINNTSISSDYYSFIENSDFDIDDVNVNYINNEVKTKKIVLDLDNICKKYHICKDEDEKISYTYKINYDLYLGDLNAATLYILKAYVKEGDKYIALANETEKESEFSYYFTTKDSSSLRVSDLAINYEADSYTNRHLTLKYNLSNIEGISSFEYIICNDKKVSADTNTCIYITENNPLSFEEYNFYKTRKIYNSNSELQDSRLYIERGIDDTFFDYKNQKGSYEARVNFDINSDFDLLQFGTNYNVKIIAKVNNNKYLSDFVLYNSIDEDADNVPLFMRKLIEPTVLFEKNATSDSVTFRVGFHDYDYVINGGKYKSSLVIKSNSDNPDTLISGTESNNIINSFNFDNTTQNDKFIYTNLDSDVLYNLKLEFKSITHNIDKDYNDAPVYNPIATKDNYGLSINQLFITASSGDGKNYTTKLIFDGNGNIQYDEISKYYIGGFYYTIQNHSGGGNNFKGYIFDDNLFTYEENRLGSNYYTKVIPDITYTSGNLGQDAAIVFYILSHDVYNESSEKIYTGSDNYHDNKNACLENSFNYLDDEKICYEGVLPSISTTITAGGNND